jgi:hypothetical protein
VIDTNQTSRPFVKAHSEIGEFNLLCGSEDATELLMIFTGRHASIG